MPFILQTNGLTKKIGSKTLVTDVNIHIPKGEIYGFLGSNGAGKTTVMKMITNLWKLTSGTIEVFGEIIFLIQRNQEKPILQGLQRLWEVVRCAGISMECNTYATSMQQIYQ